MSANIFKNSKIFIQIPLNMSPNNVNLQTIHKTASLKSATRQCRQAQSSRLQNSSQRHKLLSSSRTITNTIYKMAQLFRVSKEAVDYENLSFEYPHSRLDQPWWWWDLKTIEVNLKLGSEKKMTLEPEQITWWTFFISSKYLVFFSSRHSNFHVRVISFRDSFTIFLSSMKFIVFWHINFHVKVISWNFNFCARAM